MLKKIKIITNGFQEDSVSLLKDINLTETQEKEFEQRLEAWKNEVEANAKAKFENEIKTLKESVESNSKITEDGDLDLNEEESEILKKKLVEWKEKIKTQTEEELLRSFGEFGAEVRGIK